MNKTITKLAEIEVSYRPKKVHRVYINRLIKKMIDKNLFYVFVNLITKDKLPEFYIVPSKVIAKLLLQIIKNGWK